MKEELEKKESSLLIPFVVGGLVGAGVALLLAPKSGRELRKDIKDVAARTKDTVSNSIDRSKELFEEGKSAITGAIDAGKAAYLHERDRHRQAA